MDVSIVSRSALSTDPYPALFRDYILRSAVTTLARVQSHSGSFSTADENQVFHCLDYALALPDAWPVARDILTAIAPMMVQAGYHDGWIPYLQHGIDLALANVDPDIAAQLLLNLGWLWQLRGNFDQAHAFYSDSLRQYTICRNEQGRALALTRIAFVSALQCDYQTAHEQAGAALALLGDEDTARAAALNILGLIARRRHQWETAEQHYRAALSIRRLQNDLFNVANNLRDLGCLYREAGRHEEAKISLREAIDLYTNLDSRGEAASALTNLANVLAVTNQMEEALRHYRDAHQVFRELFDDLNLAVTTFNIGYTEFHLERSAQAKPALRDAVRRWRALGNPLMEAESLTLLGQIWLQEMQPARARSAFGAAQEALRMIESTPEVKELRHTLVDLLQEAKSCGQMTT